MRLGLPFKILNQEFHLGGAWRQQWSFDHLLQRDRLGVGGRYTVRGYDGEYTLSGDNGFVGRSELAYRVPKIGQEVYAAFDVGRVWGHGSEWLLGQTLSGAALGLRGGFGNFRYDVFVSRRINFPERFPGRRYVLGFQAALNF